MLEMIRVFLIRHPDREAFFDLIGRLFSKFSAEFLLIEKAYNTSKDAFRRKCGKVVNDTLNIFAQYP